MQDVVRSPGEPFAGTIEEPPWTGAGGSRVSWGAVLSGAVAFLATSLILWALAVAIISLATNANPTSVKGSLIACWICAMATTLAGALVGGMVAGSSPRVAGRRLGMLHGFVAWGLALLVSAFFQFTLLASTAETAVTSLANTMGVEGPAAAAGGETGQGVATPTGRRVTQPSAAPQPAAQVPTPTPYAGHVAIDYMIAAAWSWFGTWAVAGLLAIGGAGIAARRRELGAGAGGGEEPLVERRPMQPLTPATSS